MRTATGPDRIMQAPDPVRLTVTGAGGLLGQDVVEAAARRGWTITPLTRSDLDVTDPARCHAVLAATSPGWVVHCAAWTAVDAAEEEPDAAMHVNRDGASNVARATREIGGRMLYVSTDYVFGGARRVPLRTDDPPNPPNAYGRSKLAGERAVTAVPWTAEHRPLIVRSGWLYGAGGTNFVDGMVRRARRGEALRVVDDQTGRPTWTRNLAEVALDLVGLGAGGCYHVADGGTATWYDLVVETLSRLGLDVPVEAVSSDVWDAPATRPSWSVLDVSETEARLGRPMQPWREALADYLTRTTQPEITA